MLDTNLVLSKNKTADFWFKIILCIVLSCLIAPLSFDVEGPVKLTLQTYILLLCSAAFGIKIGTLNTLIYILIGGMGFPIFQDYSSGWSTVTGNSAGFFLGFIAASAVVGFLSEKIKYKQFLSNIGIWILGHAIILTLGFGRISNLYPDLNSIFQDLLLYFPSMMVKVAIGVLTLHLTGRIIDRRKSNENYS